MSNDELNQRLRAIAGSDCHVSLNTWIGPNPTLIMTGSFDLGKLDMIFQTFMKYEAERKT